MRNQKNYGHQRDREFRGQNFNRGMRDRSDRYESDDRERGLDNQRHGHSEYGTDGASGADHYGMGMGRESGQGYNRSRDRDYTRDFQSRSQWYGQDQTRGADQWPDQDQSEPSGYGRGFGQSSYDRMQPQSSGGQYGQSERSGYGRQNYMQTGAQQNSQGFYGSNQQSHSGKGPKGYKRADERIREDVSEALQLDHHVDASQIEVDVKEGIVTLSGIVDSRMAKRQAEDCLNNLSGVQDVVNNIRVERAEGMGSSSSSSSTTSSKDSQSTSKRGGSH